MTRTHGRHADLRPAAMFILALGLTRLEGGTADEPPASPADLRPTPPLVLDMERKSKQYDILMTQKRLLEAQLDTATNALADAHVRIATLETENAALKATIETLRAEQAAQRQKLEALERTLQELVLGRVEFHEVWEDETLESIAADPLVYGDKTKAEWIRLANMRRITDLDRLKPGDVLLIPRMRPSGPFEFQR